MTIEQFEKATAKRANIDKLKSIFPIEIEGRKPQSGLNIGFNLSNSKSMNIQIPQYLSENILGVIEKRIIQLIDLEEEDFKKL